ncbi:TonB-dependent receptor [Terriglobus roseus]|uniref:TonB-dependent Receptor Plug Domain n=1 Tax=Terriglobus roseus TaxID=392734 RepID=A0A1H4SGL6_9BACT|nr:TonB-dependent receptor [Terriglobus roseus]SEC43289.1 TonB-dependent Receptor Plug Domain [Terriglobus roseus]
MSSFPYKRHIATVAILGSTLAGAAHAQETTGSISGTITDPSGASIKGATVVLTNTDRGQDVRTLTTNSAGYFTATSLPLGVYTVKITAPGFSTANVTSLTLHVNDALTVNQQLKTGSAAEEVSVQANSVQLNLEDATSAGLISGEQARELVLNNRNYEQLIQLQPGVAYGGANDQLYVGSTVPSGASNQVAFAVNGGRSTSNNWTIDGADNVDRGSGLTLLVYPSVDAIAEFKTLRGTYTAQFGRGASGQINVVTKSGTNNWHGSAYEFFRNDALNANGYFNNLNGIKRSASPLRYNDFGATFGGPVRIPGLYNGRDKTFFFFSYEGRRVIQYSIGASLVPTADERKGDFTNAYYQRTNGSWTTGPVNVCTAYNASGTCTASGNRITNISPTAAAYLKDLYSLVPLPTSALDLANGVDPHTLYSSARNKFGDDQYIVRIDHSFGSRINLFYRYIHDTLPVESGTGSFTTVPIPGIANTTTSQPGTTHMGHGTFVMNPTTLFDAGYAYSSGAILTDPVGSLTTANSPDVRPTLPYANQLGVIPTLSFNGSLTALGSSGIYREHNINHNVFGSVTKTLGRTTLIAGATYNRYQKTENATGGNQGGFNFSGNPTITGNTAITQTSVNGSQAFANLLLGFANGGTSNGFSQSSLAITPDIRENVFEAYLQDNWKVTPRLTLNLGVRYSYYGQPIDANGRLSNFDPTAYNPAKAPTISSTGLICTAAPCANTDGLNSGTPNSSADIYQSTNYINGMVFGGNAVAGHASRFGSNVGPSDNTNFAPRFGFALDVFGNGKTALRGGYGWSFDESAVSYFETSVFNNPPAVSTFNAATANIDNPAGSTAAAAGLPTTPGRIVGSPVDGYKTPYVQQFSLDVQQQIAPSLMLDIGYVGTQGTHLLGMVDINEARPGAFVNRVNPLRSNPGSATVASACAYPGTATTGQPLSGTPAFMNSTCDRAINQIRPYLGYFAIDAVRSIFSSNYQSLQVKVTKTWGKSLLDANYTWSKNLTNAQNDYTTPPQNTYNINADYGLAAIDRRNILTVDSIVYLPWFQSQQGLVGHVLGGWELSGVFAMNSGLPLTASESTGSQVYYGYTNPVNGKAAGNYVNDSAGLGINGNTNAGFRPDQIANPNQGQGGRTIHNRNEWFFRGAFDTPLPSEMRPGNSKRGNIIGPGFNRLDVGIFRNFKIYESLFFQLRGEAFNVANHTNWQTVNTTATSTLFGQVTGTRDPRILQVAGKITF